MRRRWVGFVPMFAPDAYARVAKRIEPLLEALPGVRSVICAQYIFRQALTPALVEEVLSAPAKSGP